MKKVIISLIAVLFITTSIISNIYAQKNDTFTDKRDGHVYKTIKIANQEWMAENLVLKTDSDSYVYANDENNGVKYGRLYKWKVATTVCPEGWRLPSKTDFETLLNNFGGEGKKSYKALITDGTSGFSALFGGAKCLWDDTESDIGKDAYFWTSSEKDKYRWFLYISSNYKKTEFDTGYPTAWCLSVRCLKDN